MATAILPCWTHSFKGCNPNAFKGYDPNAGLPHLSQKPLQFPAHGSQRNYLVRARYEGKKITIAASDSNGCSRQEIPFGTHSRRMMLLLTASLPVMSIQNDLQFFTSNNKFNIHAAEVEEAEGEIIKTEIRKVLSKAKAAGLLRLVFHDAGTFNMAKNTGGMNGSIIYELDRPANAGLDRSVKVLEKVKAVLDLIMQVSWADLIALAGVEALALCGGPIILIKLGRQDTKSPDPDGELPAESLNASDLKECFQRKGFSVQELVALSGAHTLGNKGFGNPTIFDNSYFQILLERPWIKTSKGNEMATMIGLPSDHALVEDDECLRWITIYANNQEKFFDDFARAYVKLINSGVHWRTL
jgi:L-ascorbate peroxidase